MNRFASYLNEDLDNFISQTTDPKLKTKILRKEEKIKGKHDFIILVNSLAYIDDVQIYSRSLLKNCHRKTRIVVIYFNFLWKPILDLATYFGLRKRDIKEPNWLSPEDISSLLSLEGFDQVKKGRRLLLPTNLGFVSSFVNKYIAQLPIINSFCLTTYQIFRVRPKPSNYSVSIIIPTRNEEGNVKGVLNKIPKLGKGTEVIFVEGGSTDNTYQAIKNEISRHNNQRVHARVFVQKGRGKGDAVRLGFSKAKNNILMILDADLTVKPKDLKKFYRALAEGHGEFINGSRLVYPMEKQAMRSLNYLGNRIFSILFTYLLGQRIKDTLCGTKVLLKKDYLEIKKNRKTFGDFDPFGDFDLLFGATKLNLKMVEIPIRYGERMYGTTNISRFRHGWLLLGMTLFAAKRIKFV